MKKPWGVMEKLATKRLTELRGSVNKVEAKLADLEARKAQILVLVAQNSERLSGKGQACSMGEVQVVTVFLRNLGLALQGTQLEISALEEEREHLKSQVHEKFKEKKKMSSLIEREEKLEKRKLAHREERELNAAGIQAFLTKKTVES
jgi:flagellar export protein FliJ